MADDPFQSLKCVPIKSKWWILVLGRPFIGNGNSLHEWNTSTRYSKLEREANPRQSTPAFRTSIRWFITYLHPPPPHPILTYNQRKQLIKTWLMSIYNLTVTWSLTDGRFADLFMPQWVWYNWNYVFIGNQ